MNYEKLIKDIKFDEKGLVPCVTQDNFTGEVLMLAYMNKESLRLTLETGYVTYFSRSRQELWKKGAHSGNLQKVVTIKYDCDGDTILVKAEQTGPACHTGEKTCFFRELTPDGVVECRSGDEGFCVGAETLKADYETIVHRRDNPVEGSYTNYLFDKGIDKICKKVGEESAEIIIGAKNRNKDEVVYEISDFMYHIMVLMVEQGVTWSDIFNEIEKRRK